MSDSKVQPEPISSIWSIEKPEGRFNDWGERKWITATDKKRDQVDKEISAIGLNDRARDLFLAAKLTEARGIEFAVFSNTQIPAPLGIDKGGRIVPCFRPFNPN